MRSQIQSAVELVIEPAGIDTMAKCMAYIVLLLTFVKNYRERLARRLVITWKPASSMLTGHVHIHLHNPFDQADLASEIFYEMFEKHNDALNAFKELQNVRVIF